MERSEGGRRWRGVLAALSAAALAAAGEPPAPGQHEAPEISARLELEKAQARVGESVTIRLLLRNLTEKPLPVSCEAPDRALTLDGVAVHPLRGANAANRAVVAVEAPPGGEVELSRWDVTNLVVPAPGVWRWVAPGDLGGSRWDRGSGGEAQAAAVPGSVPPNARPGEVLLASRVRVRVSRGIAEVSAPDARLTLRSGTWTDALQECEAAAYVWGLGVAWSSRANLAREMEKRAPRPFPVPEEPFLAPELVPALVRVARDPEVDPVVRQATLQVLAWRPMRSAIEPLAEAAAEDRDPAVRSGALAAIGSISAGRSLTEAQERQVGAALAAGLADRDPAVRSAAVCAAGSPGAVPDSVREDALRLLEDPDPAVRLNAVRLRLLRKPLDADAAGVLGRLLGGPDVRVRRNAAAVLEDWLASRAGGDLPPEERSVLESLLPRLAALAADGTTLWSDRSLLPAIPPSGPARVEGPPARSAPRARSLLDILLAARRAAPEVVVRALVGVARGPADEETRTAAIDSLAGFGPEARSAADAMVEILRDPSERIRFQAARALSRVHPGALEAKPILLEALGSSVPYHQNEALQALARLRPVGDDVLGVFRGRFGSREPDVAFRALQSAPLLGPGGAPLAPDLYRGWKAQGPDRFRYEWDPSVRAIAAVAPGSDEALSMWREAAGSESHASTRDILRAAVARARGAALLPALREDLARHGGKDQARRFEAIGALGAMPAPAAADAAALLREHGKWLAEEDARGRDYSSERHGVDAALRALEGAGSAGDR